MKYVYLSQPVNSSQKTYMQQCLWIGQLFFFFLRSHFFFFTSIYHFIYFWLLLVFVAARGLSLVAASGGYSSLGLASHCFGFSCCRVVAQGLIRCGSWALERAGFSPEGSVAPPYVESSWSRGGTHVFCIGRWILIHCATRIVPRSTSLLQKNL